MQKGNRKLEEGKDLLGKNIKRVKKETYIFLSICLPELPPTPR